jgi:hypothetical protein
MEHGKSEAITLPRVRAKCLFPEVLRLLRCGEMAIGSHVYSQSGISVFILGSLRTLREEKFHIRFRPRTAS